MAPWVNLYIKFAKTAFVASIVNEIQYGTLWKKKKITVMTVERVGIIFTGFLGGSIWRDPFYTGLDYFCIL